jgi:hypothetical protein
MSPLTGFFGGVATVVVALGIGFTGGIYLTDTSFMNDPVGGKPTRSEADKPARTAEQRADPAGRQGDAPSTQSVGIAAGPKPDANSAPPAAVASPQASRIPPDQPSSEPTRAPASTTTAVEPTVAARPGLPFARAPDTTQHDAQAAATTRDEEATQAERQDGERKQDAERKKDAARKAAVREQRRLAAERAARRAAERAERRRAEDEITRAAEASAAGSRRQGEWSDDQRDDERRDLFGFASERERDRRPNFFGIPLFDE